MSPFAKCMAGATFVALGAVSVSADIVITPGPGNFPGDENVLFNRPTLLDNGPLVQGITNQSRAIVDFYGAGEDLVTPSGGQARIEGADGDFTALTIALHDANATFTTLIFNLDVCNDQPNGEVDIAQAGAEVTITVDYLDENNVAGSFNDDFALDENGQNFFRIAAINGQVMTSVSFISNVQLCDIAQVRIGGLAGTTPQPIPIPLPGAGIAGGALMGAGALVRRMRRRSR